LPGSGVVIGAHRFWGGPNKWPLTPDSGITAQYFPGQEGDATPLGPGESREAVLVASRDPNFWPTLDQHTGPVLWRVQLRRGLEAINGKDISMTAVIGVEFEPREIDEKN
jgi:hypothetical protein